MAAATTAAELKVPSAVLVARVVALTVQSRIETAALETAPSSVMLKAAATQPVTEAEPAEAATVKVLRRRRPAAAAAAPVWVMVAAATVQTAAAPTVQTAAAQVAVDMAGMEMD